MNFLNVNFVIIAVLIVMPSVFVQGQNTTNKMDLIRTGNIETRLAALEKVVGMALTGKTNGSITEIDLLKIKGDGLLRIGYEPVVFSARSSGRSGISNNVIVQFSNVISNFGKHYNPTDGIFIAPVHGLYMFHWATVCLNSGSSSGHCDTVLMVDGSIKGYTRTGENSSGYNHSSSNLVFVEVEAGKHVWIQTRSDSNQYITRYSHFSGILLAAM